MVVCWECVRKPEQCISCGNLAPVEVRTIHGPECVVCMRRRLDAKIVCSRCEQERRPSIGEPGVCERCAGETVRQVCQGCGAEENNYAAGHCARCALRIRLQQASDTGDPDATEALSAYLAALAQTTNPRTVLQWMNKKGSYETVLELLGGTLEVTHEALDTVQRGQSTIYLRAALVRHGVLPERHQQSVSLAAFIDRELLRLPDGPDRVHLRTFAIWKVQHDLARAERQGRIKRTSQHFARTKIRVSTDLLLWLSEQHMTLPDLRQEHLDYWLADGSSQRPRVSTFILWATHRGIIKSLTVLSAAARTHIHPLDSHQRLQMLRTLLEDESLDLRDRVAGCLVLLFAQQISRLVLLKKDDIQVIQGHVFVRLGREPLLLPEPLATLILRLRQAHPPRGNLARSTEPEWMFAGLRLDTAMHEEVMRRRLRKLGITVRAARSSAALQLAQTLPAAILAETPRSSTSTTTMTTGAQVPPSSASKHWREHTVPSLSPFCRRQGSVHH